MHKLPIILQNSAKCLLCGDEIVSKHRRDFRSCGCGNLSVDGGTAYTRRAWKLGPPVETWIDTSIFEDDEV